ncbi:TraR/DksA C4-type zinc finger protein [Aggregatibacter actinomycetemcomitans]|uniref:TraR/DksA C4-type zinc finger protein n=1 Tax=Aggregatibacter actinomycetemcomitans TaxID=714 RepID=UPI00197B2E27|nr:TraR/DksA C4-type zinc finger protein [Aggregatibacter actinomycetemcomitans]MBN6079892.1 TraR/DksA C4-type zinc finger protein [Aggregatibacter actinomycetemcomitans]
MTDILDRAQELEQLQREIALKRRVTMTHQESALCCEDCGEEIPQQRRAAIRGVIRCVACQGNHERRLRNFRK